ncbi:hypothetical protein DICPUDRAFT_38199 [Dictyostelium purpureum]|uniref:Uncharacterized protein n=1 Tax=Dictyostelium purpureum TaxID=5786 RepID=F0ZU16_DICPU|nr:uncharacterized protein DICPUDRAFT_38199 [Dictyostelium purpureum]EGC32565.1 hypothetical protein DICPUDRAFT_38199 [Dictyostelium purpureum]|eukprot:XP_003290902.1 hypothetical protein DICPUDRAFT_38199 [Dictyostelium purpureum]
MFALRSIRSASKVLSTSTIAPQPQRGFFTKFLFPSERQLRREYLENNNIKVGSPEFDKYYAEQTPSKLSQETGLSDALLDDPILHICVIKYNKNIVERYNLTPEQENDIIANYDISAGDPSLEQILPLPVPEHNFSELPIVKVYNE